MKSLNQWLSIALLSLAAWGSPAFAIDWPAGEASTRAQAFLSAYNSDDEKALAGFVEKAFSPASLAKTGAPAILGQFKGMKEQLGNLKAESAVVDGNKIVVKVTSETLGALLDLNLSVGKDAPFFVTGLSAQPAT